MTPDQQHLRRQAALTRHFTTLRRKRSRRGLPAPQVLVQAPHFEFKFGDLEQPFHAASVGKLVTSTVVMRLVERELLSLDTLVLDVLSPSTISGLFMDESATVGDLLAHTSGVADYFEGKTHGSPTMVNLMVSDPDRMWQPDELVEFSRAHQKPSGSPGDMFSYSDTGFVLLGLIVEAVTKDSFTEAIHAEVLGPAGMEETVLWLREPGPSRIEPAFIAETDVSSFTSVSCDWAGGGIVSTVADLSKLVRALADGSLVSQKTFQLMAAPKHRFRRGIDYGLGVMSLGFSDFMPLLRGLDRPFGHIGVLATHAFYYSEYDATVVLNFHGTREMVASFKSHIRIAQALQRLA